MADALQALRRLQKREVPQAEGALQRTEKGGSSDTDRGEIVALRASSKAALTRESFLGLVQAAQARIGRDYVSGLLERLSEDEERPILEAEERMDSAYRAGDFGAAVKALEAWERTWRETIQAVGGKP